ncbi:MAG: hypothetical protein D3906_04960 [Candidatus Electrothrix sp. AUS1_2]|nr:hypothetical protein [Candidatus Electrothrix sp. AUS1_2]
MHYISDLTKLHPLNVSYSIPLILFSVSWQKKDGVVLCYTIAVIFFCQNGEGGVFHRENLFDPFTSGAEFSFSLYQTELFENNYFH